MSSCPQQQQNKNIILDEHEKEGNKNITGSWIVCIAGLECRALGGGRVAIAGLGRHAFYFKEKNWTVPQKTLVLS